LAIVRSPGVLELEIVKLVVEETVVLVIEVELVFSEECEEVEEEVVKEHT